MPVINVFESGAQLGAPADNTSRVRADNSGELAVARENAGLARTFAAGVDKMQEAIATADVMAANNEYNRRMSELENKLFQNKESNAFENLAKLDEGRKKILDSIAKKGPQTLRYGAGARAFYNSVERDYVNQRSRMEKYTIGETEKYRDTQLNLQLETGLKDITANYGDDDTLNQSIRRNDFMISARFYNYGPARIKLEQDKAKAAAVNTAVAAAINGNDYNRAGELLQGYGSYLTPQARMNYDKVLQEYNKSNMQVVEFKNLYARYGADINAAMAELERGGAYVNTAAGMDFARGSIGEQRGVNQCANFVSDCIRTAGGNSALCSSLADGMYKNFEDAGLLFTDRAELKDGDVVFWRVEGSGYAASDNPDSVQSGTEAYNGVTHTGVYDAKTGKVIQSGTHGVTAMDIDAKGYTAVGFGRVGGQALSPVEIEKRKKEYSAYARGQESQRKYNESQMIEQTCDRMLADYNNGERDAMHFMQIAKDAAGNDYSTYSALTSVAEAFGNAGGYKLTFDEQLDLEQRIGDGVLSNTQLINELKEKNVDVKTIMKYVKENSKAAKGEGKYGFDWTNIVNVVQENVGTKLTAKQKMGIKNYGQWWVEDYHRQNGRLPSLAEVIDTGRAALVKGVGGVEIPGRHFWNSNTSYSAAELITHDITGIQDAGDSMVYVYFKGNSVPVLMDKAALQEEMGE